MQIFSVVLATAALAIGVSAIPAGTPTASAPQATETLGEGQHWIRTADSLYLQAAVPWTATDAVLGPGSTAGEFNVVSTSLFDTVHTPNFLVTTVEPLTAGATMLKVSFVNGLNAPASSGVFAWSGANQSLTWSREDVTFTGWITCANNVLYANISPTVPAGCNAVSIASYIGPTAV